MSIIFMSFQEWWNQAAKWIDWFFNKPLPIIGVSLFFVLLFVLKIISTTSIGKKQLNALREEKEKLEFDYKALNLEMNQIVEVANIKLREMDEKLKRIEEEKENQYIDLKEYIVSTFDMIHNKNVKENTNNFLKKYEVKHETENSETKEE